MNLAVTARRSNLLYSAFTPLLVASRDDNCGTLLGEGSGGLFADATGPACDKNCFFPSYLLLCLNLS